MGRTRVLRDTLQAQVDTFAEMTRFCFWQVLVWVGMLTSKIQQWNKKLSSAVTKGEYQFVHKSIWKNCVPYKKVQQLKIEFYWRASIL